MMHSDTKINRAVILKQLRNFESERAELVAEAHRDDRDAAQEPRRRRAQRARSAPPNSRRRRRSESES
eukprot:7032023-Prymnesium_polylepis.1